MKTIGSRAEVFHETAEKTSGGLMKKDLKKNRHGYIVSVKKSKSAKNKKHNPLLAQGFQQKKNSHTFGPLNNESNKKSKKNNNNLTKKSNKKSLKSKLCDFFKLY